MKDESKGKFRDSLGDLLNDLPDEVEGLANNTEELQPIKIDSGQSAALVKARNKAEAVMKRGGTVEGSEDMRAEQEYSRAKAALDESA